MTLLPSDIRFRRHPVDTSNPQSKMHWAHIALVNENGYAVQVEEPVMGFTEMRDINPSSGQLAGSCQRIPRGLSYRRSGT